VKYAVKKWIGFNWPRMGFRREIFFIGAENSVSDTRELFRHIYENIHVYTLLFFLRTEQHVG
jgi:hypothetical protein